MSTGYANVVAYLTYQNTWMGINAYANSIPSGTHTLSCIYRNEPISGSSGSWMSCGSPVSGSASYLTTSTTSFCPVPGTRWHAFASLYKGSVWKQDDNKWKVAV
ncbi:hypothetical protein RCH16_003661 [Cryobacterium sp. MP_M5]|nr:hypothetical protein [Cryobacterium sp. MP_M3]MEC5178621.1 hypothetical protein [Cryobacterium sp. MP_M5]